MGRKTISVGGVRVRLCSSHAGFWSCADRFYDGFFAEDEGLFDDSIDVSVLPHGQLAATDGAVGTASMVATDTGEFELVHPYGTAEWDSRRRSGCVRLAEWDYNRGEASTDYVCHALVTTVVAHRLVERQCCLVHAASVVRDGKGYLFVGPSGAGKSTIARLSAATCSILGDDLSLVAELDGGFRILATPFLRQFRTVTARETAPLTAICFLTQSTRNALVPMPKSRAVWELSKSIRYAAQNQSTAQTLLDLAVRICERTSCYELRFIPDSSFWRCFDD
jgi:hypothetical protein